MATKMFFREATASTHRGTNSAKLDGTTSFWWAPRRLDTTQGTSAISRDTNTATGPTNGVEVVLVAGTSAIEWLSEPLAADVTISGTITCNIRCAENSMSANVSINCVVDKLAAATGTITQVVKTARVTEEALTTETAANFTATPTSTAFNRGDRIRVRIFGDDSTAATMASTFLFTVWYDGATGATGDSWIQFTETLTFETTAPTGSTYYLTDTAETINPGSATEKKALTTRGSGSANSVTNTASGPTAGIQATATAGGTAIEWYTPPLNAVTLGGMAQFNIRSKQSGTARASHLAEIAVTATDGSAATVWGIANLEAIANTAAGEINPFDAAKIAWVAGDDTSVAAGQRLRFRIYVDDCADTPLITGFTVTVTYNGASAAAAGDTYVILPVAVTEQSGAAAVIPDVGMALAVT